MSKQLDEQTTRLLYAASRGDVATITLICEASFDPNHGDYDKRTALMVASMKGNTDVCRLLLKYKVCMLKRTILFERSLESNYSFLRFSFSYTFRRTPIWRICTGQLLVSSYVFNQSNDMI